VYYLVALLKSVNSLFNLDPFCSKVTMNDNCKECIRDFALCT